MKQVLNTEYTERYRSTCVIYTYGMYAIYRYI